MSWYKCGTYYNTKMDHNNTVYIVTAKGQYFIKPLPFSLAHF